MTEYFDRFKDLEKKERKELEAETPLSEKVRFDKGDIFYNGKKVFTVPIKDHTQNCINILGIDNEYKIVYAGTGHCCHGHVYVLSPSEGTLDLDHIMTPNTNALDILPVSDRSIIIAGIGCAGNGVRLIDFEKPIMIDVIGKELFNSYGRVEGRPSLDADIENKKIYLKPKNIRRIDITPILAKHVDIEAMIERCKNFARIKDE